MNCLEDNSEDYQNCSVSYYLPQKLCTQSTRTSAVSAVLTGVPCITCWFRFSLGFFACFSVFFLPVPKKVCLLCIFGVFSLVFSSCHYHTSRPNYLERLASEITYQAYVSSET